MCVAESEVRRRDHRAVGKGAILMGGMILFLLRRSHFEYFHTVSFIPLGNAVAQLSNHLDNDFSPSRQTKIVSINRRQQYGFVQCPAPLRSHQREWRVHPPIIPTPIISPSPGCCRCGRAPAGGKGAFRQRRREVAGHRRRIRTGTRISCREAVVCCLRSRTQLSNGNPVRVASNLPPQSTTWLPRMGVFR